MNPDISLIETASNLIRDFAITHAHAHIIRVESRNGAGQVVDSANYLSDEDRPDFLAHWVLAQEVAATVGAVASTANGTRIAGLLQLIR